MPPHRNQHKPLPQPQSEFDAWIRYYWDLGKNDSAIADHILDHFDKSIYACSAKSIQRARARLGLKGTRQRAATYDDIGPSIAQIRERYPTWGARQIVNTLRLDYALKVPEKRVLEYLREIEPDQVRARKRFRFKRKQYVSTGVMDVITLDQHDKWKRFHLYLHVGLDPYPGKILWLKIWWTNRNSRLIAHFYLEACRRLGGVALLTQSDPGTENNAVANCQTNIRQCLDPSLEGTLQHQWRRNKTNIKPETFWSVLRRYWSPGFEDILEGGQLQDVYNADNAVDRLVFRWVFIPFLQHELDEARRRYNLTKRRRDKNKILPQGEVPELIAAKPERFGGKNYMVTVPEHIFDAAQQRWAPPTDPVFQLVPHDFEVHIQHVSAALDLPPVSVENIWVIYAQLRDALHGKSSSLQWVQSRGITYLAIERDLPIERWDNEASEGFVFDVPLLDNAEQVYPDVYGDLEYVEFSDSDDDTEGGHEDRLEYAEFSGEEDA
ncbi:hypothetical protein GGG16DRAFT_117261 [Schizophyllum commune]